MEGREESFPVTIGINSFRAVLDEFQKKRDNKELPEIKMKKEKKKKEKDREVYVSDGVLVRPHQFNSLVMQINVSSTNLNKNFFMTIITLKVYWKCCKTPLKLHVPAGVGRRVGVGCKVQLLTDFALSLCTCILPGASGA